MSLHKLPQIIGGGWGYLEVPTSIFVCGLLPDDADDDVTKLFSAFGKVANVVERGFPALDHPCGRWDGVLPNPGSMFPPLHFL